jgi:ATP-dependent DNA helicase RecQ
MVDVIESLRRHFGHASFRPGQEELVRAVLDGRDVLAVMPTGSGKSLGFQLPAVLLPGAPARAIGAVVRRRRRGVALTAGVT